MREGISGMHGFQAEISGLDFRLSRFQARLRIHNFRLKLQALRPSVAQRARESRFQESLGSQGSGTDFRLRLQVWDFRPGFGVQDFRLCIRPWIARSCCGRLNFRPRRYAWISGLDFRNFGLDLRL